MSTAVVTDQMGLALAELIAAEAATGIYLAVGEGLAEWDELPAPPQPDRIRTTLHNEIARVLVSVEYLDEAGAVVLDPTNRLACNGLFGIGVANGTLREMALFVGGATINTGHMIAVAHFGAISKPAGGSDFSLTRVMRLVLLAR